MTNETHPEFARLLWEFVALAIQTNLYRTEQARQETLRRLLNDTERNLPSKDRHGGFYRVGEHLVEFYDETGEIFVRSFSSIPNLTPFAGWECPRVRQVPEDVLTVLGHPTGMIDTEQYRYVRYWKQPWQWVDKLLGLGFKSLPDETLQREEATFFLLIVPEVGTKPVLALTWAKDGR